MASDLYAPGSLACANCGKPANATVLVGTAQEHPVCDDCMAKAADWKPPAAPKSRGRPALRRLKYPDHAARGERCPWCQKLDHGRCSGCGQQYGEPDDTTGSTARRVTRKAGALALHAPVPPVEVPDAPQANAVSEAPAPTVPQPVVLVLPEAPSANVWWRRAGNRMHLSHEAREYKADVALRAGVHGKPIFPDEPLSIVIVWRRARKSGDLDKRLGVLLDALQSWTDGKGLRHPGVYENDSQIVQLWARRCDEHPELAPGSVRVEVSATT